MERQGHQTFFGGFGQPFRLHPVLTPLANETSEAPEGQAIPQRDKRALARTAGKPQGHNRSARKPTPCGSQFHQKASQQAYEYKKVRIQEGSTRRQASKFRSANTRKCKEARDVQRSPSSASTSYNNTNDVCVAKGMLDLFQMCCGGCRCHALYLSFVCSLQHCTDPQHKLQ